MTPKKLNSLSQNVTSLNVTFRKPPKQKKLEPEPQLANLKERRVKSEESAQEQNEKAFGDTANIR